jgi:hypothetical protein
METFVILVVVLAAFGIVAVRAGYDSRPGAESAEESLAKLGMTWGEVRSADEPRKRQRWAGVRPWLVRRTSRPIAEPS